MNIIRNDGENGALEATACPVPPELGGIKQAVNWVKMGEPSLRGDRFFTSM